MITNWYHLTTSQFGYPQPENDFGYISKTYDSSNACLTCNAGLRQKDEFRFRNEPKLKHSQFFGLNWIFDQVFIRQVIKDILEMEQITGIAFSQPEGPFCGRTKYNYPKGNNHIRIKADALNHKTDFIRLDYYFGSGGDANRPIIISERVKQIIEREKWRGAFLHQIEMV